MIHAQEPRRVRMTYKALPISIDAVCRKEPEHTAQCIGVHARCGGKSCHIPWSIVECVGYACVSYRMQAARQNRSSSELFNLFDRLMCHNLVHSLFILVPLLLIPLPIRPANEREISHTAT